VNRLRIPSIGIDGVINEGETDATLDKGIWHRPNSSTPDKGSNTVLAAHRFKYLSGSNTFFYLDKVQLNDSITVLWGATAYSYQVYAIEVVGPEDVAIESPTPDAELTLYSCTPLWTSKKRLVVHAKQVAAIPRSNLD